jgi:hypothetical protein
LAGSKDYTVGIFLLSMLYCLDEATASLCSRRHSSGEFSVGIRAPTAER